MELKAKKDGKGNIVIEEGSFEMLLACLDNQKFVHEAPINGDSVASDYVNTRKEIQDAIDLYNREARKILHQHYKLRTESDGYFLVKKYEHQEGDIEWTGEDVGKVYELFKDTRIVYENERKILPLEGDEEIKEGSNPLGKIEDGWIVMEPGSRPWLIERPLRYDGVYLTISEDGRKNRAWKKEEIERIGKILNGYDI